ncbi:hypothetical protein Micbo1qcDRAFT_31491 [Microdochium bolleyi]|uniref:Uncharacterized protein n=1 Tax=Microdochium bolleyi TaxID=196109 RepID=A0A136JGC9_9PEZI|nr:hypothetical protein Micbo1qcDRAFT_31491 [Microdochium bolleyi]
MKSLKRRPNIWTSGLLTPRVCSCDFMLRPLGVRANPMSWRLLCDLPIPSMESDSTNCDHYSSCSAGTAEHGVMKA